MRLYHWTQVHPNLKRVFCLYIKYFGIDQNTMTDKLLLLSCVIMYLCWWGCLVKYLSLCIIYIIWLSLIRLLYYLYARVCIGFYIKVYIKVYDNNVKTINLLSSILQFFNSLRICLRNSVIPVLYSNPWRDCYIIYYSGVR